MKKNKNNKKVNTSVDFEFNSPYITIPSEIADDSTLSPTDKMVLAVILSLQGLQGNSYAYAGTKYIAKVLKMSVRTIQHSISELILKNLIDVKKRGKKRLFKTANEYDVEDAKVIIPSDVLANETISNTYKITYGYLVAAGLNNLMFYDFESILKLADYLKISVSSVYRHLNRLDDAELVERVETANLGFYTLDNYSISWRKQRTKELNEAKALAIKKQRREFNDQQILTPEVESVLKRIWNKL